MASSSQPAANQLASLLSRAQGASLAKTRGTTYLTKAVGMQGDRSMVDNLSTEKQLL